MKTQPIAVLTVLLSLVPLTASVLSAQDQPNQIAAVSAAAPVPVINVPLLPDAQHPGAAAFTLVVNGTGFVAGAVVRWNGSARTTTFVSASQLKAAILATDVAIAGVAAVTVRNSSSGGTSNVAYFEIAGAVPALLMSKTSYATGS